MVLAVAGVAVALRILLAVRSPTPFGYVWDFYADGVEVLYSRGRLPIATDCWQCYHPPLFYVLGWPLYALGRLIAPGAAREAGLRVLGVLPLVCAGVTIYYGYRLLRLFRCRGGSLIAGLSMLAVFPCLFISSYGAEADILVTAILSALMFYLARDAGRQPRPGLVPPLRLGVLAGLAAATKYSGLVGLAVVLTVLGLHALTGRRRALALAQIAVVTAACVCVGGWKYVDNERWYGTPLKANGSAAASFTLKPRAAISRRYEFLSFRLGELLDSVGMHAASGMLTRLPVYYSVPTTLHGLGWSDMNFFSEPTRHGDPSQPYPLKHQVWAITASVLVLGLAADALAVAGFVLTIRRRRFAPLSAFVLLGIGAYAWWFLGQAEWGLKTKYVLFLLPAFALYISVSLAWLWRRAPAALALGAAALVAALVIVAHVYLAIFAIG
jgi:hypothetical protein